MEKTSKNTSNIFILLEENSKSCRRCLGRQLGHKSVSRSLSPEEQVNHIVPCYPSEICSDCRGTIEVQKQVARSQAFNVPISGFKLTAYQVYQGCCFGCQQLYRRALLSEAGQCGFGIRLHAFIGLFTSKFRLGKWQVVHGLKDIYGLLTSTGSISNVERRVSESIANTRKKIKMVVRQETILNVDKTGFHQQNCIDWAWVAATKKMTYGVWLLKAYDGLFKFWKTGSRVRWLYPTFHTLRTSSFELSFMR